MLEHPSLKDSLSLSLSLVDILTFSYKHVHIKFTLKCSLLKTQFQWVEFNLILS